MKRGIRTTKKSATPESNPGMTLHRRDFLGAVAAGLAGAGLGLRAGPATATEPQAWTDITVEVKADQPAR